MDDRFDYVIVGGGTAGCVLAARLSEDPAVSVLVLEAGPAYRGLAIRIPAAVASLYRKGAYHGPYTSQAEPSAAGQRLPYKMGRILGGSSAINGMIWLRGNRADYDGWAASGCGGWSFAEVEPVFRRIEATDDPTDPYMGRNGPIGLTRGDTRRSPLNRAFLQAARQAGFDLNPHSHGVSQDGFSGTHRNTHRGARCDVYEGYLKPALGRPNLHIRTGALVGRLTVADGRVAGVDYRTGDSLRHATASREVLLSAGALASPQLLQLSGIGDPELLNGLGMPVVHALPGVGLNLHTHPALRVSFSSTRPVSIYRWSHAPGSWLAGLVWLATRGGPAASNHMEVGGFVRSRPDLDRPDLIVSMLPIAYGATYDKAMNGFGIYLELVGCKSRGWVRAVSRDPAMAPEFVFNLLEDTRDVAALRWGVGLIRRLAAQPAYEGLCGEELFPGTAVASDAEIDAWLRRNVQITHHLAGSCRMGPRDDPLAVVAPDLKVHSLGGLRIVDASIMPVVPTANTHAAVVMIAEKAADMIRGADDAVVPAPT